MDDEHLNTIISSGNNRLPSYGILKSEAGENNGTTIRENSNLEISMENISNNVNNGNNLNKGIFYDFLILLKNFYTCLKKI